MKDIKSIIEEDLKIQVGLGATYHCGSDAYPYYISEVLPNGVIGLYKPDAHFEKDWTDGYQIVDPFDAAKQSEIYIRRSYGNWWVCEKNGKRMHKWHSISFGHASSYRDPSF